MIGIIFSIALIVFAVVWIVHEMGEATKFRDDEDRDFWDKLTK